METRTGSRQGDVARGKGSDELLLVHGSSHLAQAVAELLQARGIPFIHVINGNEHHGAAPTAALLCDDDDVANIAFAIDLHERAPDVRIVLRSYNQHLAHRLPDVLGDCRVLSSSALAARPLCDLAVGPGGPSEGPRRRGAVTRVLDRMRGSHPAAVIRQLWRRPLMRWMLGAMVLLIVVQSLVVRAAFDLDAEQSLHVGIASIITFGFADAGLAGAELANHSAPVQVMGVVTMLVDVVLVTTLLALVTDVLVGERLARVFGGSSRRLRGHVVVAGLGTVGFRVVDELTARGYRCAVMESDDHSPFLFAANRLGVHVTIADVRQGDEFAQLGIDRAVAVLALTDDDAANLEVAFTASSIAPDVPVVVRCFDPALAATLERLEGIAACRSVGRLAAPAFVRAALEPVRA